MPINDLTPFLDPDLRAVFSSLPPIVDAVEDPEAARMFRDQRFARLAARAQDAPGPVSQADLMIPALSSDGSVPVRIYRPAEQSGPLPAIVWLHGGGFTGGSIKYEDSICHRFVVGVGAVVISVEYRLLPEFPFPAAIEDTYAALKWATNDAPGDLVDPTRVAVAGLSAGATLAAGAALLSRDRGEIALSFQLLLYGSTDEKLDTFSSHEFCDPRSPNRRIAAGIWKSYLGEAATHPPGHAVPLRAPSLKGLPPAYVMVGGVEMVRDENVEYAQRLMSAQVPTELHVVPGAFHGFDVLVPEAPISVRARDEYVHALKRGLSA